MSRKPTIRKQKNGAKPVEAAAPTPQVPPVAVAPAATPSPRREPVVPQPLCTATLKSYSIVPNLRLK